MDRACPQCGARYLEVGDSCDARWERLLALDHSRVPPWGLRHGLAFATFTMQHPDSACPESLARCWDILRRVVIRGEEPRAVFASYRGGGEAATAASVDRSLAPRAFAVTIADLGDFEAHRYPVDLDRWAAATVAAWSARLDAGGSSTTAARD